MSSAERPQPIQPDPASMATPTRTKDKAFVLNPQALVIGCSLLFLWVSIEGYDVSKPTNRQLVRRQLGYVPQEFAFSPGFTEREFLDYIGLLKGLYNRSTRDIHRLCHHYAELHQGRIVAVHE